VINFSGLGVEDVLTESYPLSASSFSSSFTRTNASHTPHPHHFNFFHHNDMYPALDCQTGYVCSYLRHTQRTADNDRDGDGKVDAERLHEEERRVDRDGDGDVDVNDELPTKEQSEQKHLELVFGEKWDLSLPIEELPDPHPKWIEYLGMYALCALCLCLSMLCALSLSLLCAAGERVISFISSNYAHSISHVRSMSFLL